MNETGLAVMAKIRMLYERGEESNSFLAFHPFAHPLTEADLAFTDPDSDVASPQELTRAAADFATFVNLVPTVDAVWMYDGRLVWNEYGTIFKLADVADDHLSAEERKELEAARQALYEERDVTDPDTGETKTELVETADHEAYRRYERAYRDVRQRYTAAVITAENAEDPEVRAEAEAERDDLEAEVEAAMRDWKGKGHKNEIEEAFADVDRLTGRGPQLLWQDWQEQFDRTGPESDVLVDRTFYPTSYWPSNFYREEAAGSWTTVTMDGSEVTSLVRRAREDMSELVDSGLLDDQDQADLEIERLSVELARVEIVRPWFDPAVLRSRVWRWRHGREPLSDGEDPPRGSLPAYATSMVFARNLEIELAPQSEPNLRAVDRLKDGDLVSFGPLLLNQVPSTADADAVSRLEGAAFDPEETQALRELTSEVAVARSVPARGGASARMAVEVEHADVIARNPALADLATGIAGSNVRANPAARSADGVGRVERLPFRASLDIRPERPTATNAPERVPARRSGSVRRRDPHSEADDSHRSDRVRVRDHRSPGPRIRDHRSHRPRVRDHRTNRPPISIDPGDIPIGDRPEPAPSGGFKGRVRERGADGRPGDPIDAVRITFDRDGSSSRKTVQTDENGEYRVRVPPGRYLVTARRYGYVDYPSSTDPWAGVVILTGDGFQSFDVTLERDPTEQTTVEAWETMQLVAFICEKVPEAPNPDPELAWN